jgi:hypothetical protein
MTMYFVDQGFPSCCSMRLLHKFRTQDPGFDGLGSSTTFYKENGNVGQVAIITSSQVAAKRWLLENKFKAVKTFHGPRHGSILTLWIRVPEKARKLTAGELLNAVTVPAVKKKKRVIKKRSSLRG